MMKLDIQIFSTGQRKFLKEYTQIMGIIADALNNLQGNKRPYGVVLPTLYRTKDQLIEMSSNQSIVCCKPLLTAALNGFNKRFHEIMDLNNKASYPALIATVSHPYFKLRWLKPELQTTEQIDKIKQILSAAADEISLENAALDRNANKENNQTQNVASSQCSLKTITVYIILLCILILSFINCDFT